MEVFLAACERQKEGFDMESAVNAAASGIDDAAVLSKAFAEMECEELMVDRS